MDPREMETLVQRLVQNPHDQEAIQYAHQSGQADPRAYAMLLEKVGTATQEPGLASHWLTEAAKVWSTTLGDAHRAARALMAAVDKNPAHPLAADHLAELYRERNDIKALVALLDRRAKALAVLAERDPVARQQAALVHEELGRLWAAPPLNQARRAVENYRRAIEYDPTSQYSIYALRELYKSHRQWTDAIPLFELELRLVDDPERRASLLCDEAEVRRGAGDLAGATQAYRTARTVEGGEDPGLKQQVAALVLDRVRAQETVLPAELEEAADLFVGLAEQYPGEHGFSYSLCALELQPTHDRAMQLAIYYGEQLGRSLEVAPKAAEYLKGNPSGVLAREARGVVTGAMQLGGDDSLLEALTPAPGAGPEETLESLLEVAHALEHKAKKQEAAEKYREVLALEPSNADAMAFLESHYRATRKFAELGEMLLAAARSPTVEAMRRASWFKEIALLCESQLKDPLKAIEALREVVLLDPQDEAARSQFKRLLEEAEQWDALAEVLAAEAEQVTDAEARILIERSLAKLHEQRRNDPIAAGETWARIATLAPNDEGAIWTAIGHFEAVERQDFAARVIADNLGMILEPGIRSPLLQKLGDLRLVLGESLGAGEAYAEGASLVKSAELWRAAEDAFVRAAVWDHAAEAADERAQLASSNSEKAVLYALEADYLARDGDQASSLMHLERAAELDPENPDHAQRLEEIYTRTGRTQELASFLLKRAGSVQQRDLRVELRRRAAQMQREGLSDVEGARSTLLELLRDGDDPDALFWLADDAEHSGDPAAAVDYLSRLEKVIDDPAERVGVVMREAALRAEGLDDANGALNRYAWILAELDSKHTGVLERIADLEERLDNPKATAEALERRLTLLETSSEKLETAERLAQLYEGPLQEPKAAIRVLDVLRDLEPENYDAVQRLCELCERIEDWPRVAALLATLVEIEGDLEERSRMTRRLATILHQKVDRGDEALAALMRVGDQGDIACREEYVRLGDELGWKGIVASKLVEWYVNAAAGPERVQALRGAFDRFLIVERDVDATDVAKELIRTHGADRELAERLEGVAVRLKDRDALAMAHGLIAQSLSGAERAEEFVRQAEILTQAGAEAEQAIQHGEQWLTGVPPSDVGSLLERLAVLAGGAQAVIDIYERQVTRCKVPSDRWAALARAARVAAKHDAVDRARQFLEIALSGHVSEEALVSLERTAAESDQERGGDQLRRILTEAYASGGQASRDGGKTRSALLGRAAQIAHRDLGDTERAFQWLGDSIVAHADDERLDALESLAEEVGDPRRAEAVLSRGLEEVYDGPLVRKLLARRAQLRRGKLGDLAGAAADLKRLYDLSPSDAAAADELAVVYTELADYRGMVHLYEDQILRGKDPTTRAELACLVAQLWEEKLDDARESADAWRRVLRMKPGDKEATAGLERAKSNMLRHREASVPAPASTPVESPPAVRTELLKSTAGSADASPGRPAPPAPKVAEAGAPEVSAPIPLSKPEAQSELEARSELETPLEPKARPELETPLQPKARPELETPLQPKARSELETQRELEARSELETPLEPKARPELETPLQPKARSELETQPELGASGKPAGPGPENLGEDPAPKPPPRRSVQPPAKPVRRPPPARRDPPPSRSPRVPAPGSGGRGLPAGAPPAGDSPASSPRPLASPAGGGPASDPDDFAEELDVDDADLIEDDS